MVRLMAFFLKSWRIRLMISLARVPSLSILVTAARLFEIRGVASEPSQAAVGVGDGGGDQMIDFVRQRNGQLSHRGHPVHVRELGMRLAQPLALSLRALALGDVDDGTYELEQVPRWAKHGMADHVNVPDLAARMNDSGIRFDVQAPKPTCVIRKPLLPSERLISAFIGHSPLRRR
jgi:hypothetical protein